MFETLTAILEEVKASQAEVRQVHRLMRYAQSTGPGGGDTEIGMFCDDVTQVILKLDSSVATATTRIGDTGRGMRRIEDALLKVQALLEGGDAAGHTDADRQRRASDHGVQEAASSAPDAALRIRRILSTLAPVGTPGRAKVRVGGDRRGGYVMIDDFAGVTAALSASVDPDDLWKHDITARRIEVRSFGNQALDAALSGFEQADQPNLLLRIGLAGDGWRGLDTVDEELLGRCKQIVCDLHQLERLVEPEFGDQADRIFRKLCRTHFVHHVHGDNRAGFANIANVIVPRSVEVSFALRSAYATDDAVQIFPTQLDRPNQPGRADLFLDRFHFGDAV